MTAQVKGASPPVDPKTNLHISVDGLSAQETVAKILEHAAGLQVSDLFFATDETHVSVRVRHLGMLRLVTIIPAEEGRRCIAHIKAVANMEIAERRRPLDGRWIFERESGTIDLRINSI